MDAAAWNARYAASDSVWGAEPNRWVRAYCERLPVGRALDLGCGEGRNARWLARLGWQVHAVDYSDVAVARGRELAATEKPSVAARIRWSVADVTTLPVRRRSLDLVLVSYLHLPPAELADVVTRAADGVASRGHLLIVGHDRRNLREGVSGPQDEALLYDAAALRSLLGGSLASRRGSPVAPLPDTEDEDGWLVEIARTVERPTPAGRALDTVLRARRR